MVHRLSTFQLECTRETFLTVFSVQCGSYGSVHTCSREPNKCERTPRLMFQFTVFILHRPHASIVRLKSTLQIQTCGVFLGLFLSSVVLTRFRFFSVGIEHEALISLDVGIRPEAMNLKVKMNPQRKMWYGCEKCYLSFSSIAIGFPFPFYSVQFENIRH